LSLIFLAATLAPGQEPAVANPKAPQSPRQPLVATANAPEDHLSLAVYFRELASQEEALAKSYDHLARIYKEKVLPAGLDAVSAREMKDQYKRLAEVEKKAAAAAATIAAYHTRLAELVVHSPTAAEHTRPRDASAFRR
jgi:hypothetical protein